MILEGRDRKVQPDLGEVQVLHDRYLAQESSTAPRFTSFMESKVRDLAFGGVTI